MGDDPQTPRYIQTIHRRGYRFVSPVEAESIQAAGHLATPGRGPEAAAQIQPSIAVLVPWSLAVLLGATLVVALWKLTHPAAAIQPRVTRFEVALPAGGVLRGNTNNLAASPDGRLFAFSACTDTGCRLYVRTLDATTPRALEDTTGASAPFFSPDGRAVGFFADGKLKKAALAGGTAAVLCDAPEALGGTWLDDGRIVFAAHETGGLETVDDNGGAPSPLTHVDPRTGELGHRAPHWLPGTDTIIFTATTSPADPEAARAMALPVAGTLAHVVTGRSKGARLLSPEILVFSRGTGLEAARFDPARRLLTTLPTPVSGDVRSADDGEPLFAVSAQGTLFHVSGRETAPVLDLANAGGRGPLPAALTPFGQPALDREALHVAGVISDGLKGDLWIGDPVRGTATRLTHDAPAAAPIWSTDGQHVIYSAAADGPFNLWIADAGAPSSRRLLTSRAHQFASSVTASGLVVFTQIDPETRGDIWMTEGDGRVTPLVKTAFDERAGAISPDGRWLAYLSDESGRWQVYVKARQGPSRFVVSPAGGGGPWWLDDGRLVYVSASGDLDEWTMAGKRPFGGGKVRAFPGGTVLAVAPSGAVLVSRRHAPLAPPTLTLEVWREISRALPPALTTLPR
jgi:serine/threonine-protein kinase